MPDDVLAKLRPAGGWSTPAPADVPSPPGPAPAPALEADEWGSVERWLLACIWRGHVRWRGDGTRRVATRSCAHTNAGADVTDDITVLVAAGHAERRGPANEGGVYLTTDGRRRLDDLDRADAHTGAGAAVLDTLAATTTGNDGRPSSDAPTRAAAGPSRHAGG